MASFWVRLASFGNGVLILNDLLDGQLGSIGFVLASFSVILRIVLLILNGLLASFLRIFYMGGGGILS